MTTPIPPNYDTTWINNEQAAQDAAKVLRLPTAGAEYDRLLIMAEAAGLAITQFLDRDTPIDGATPTTVPGPLRFAHSSVTVELYRRKDAPFGVLDAWSPDTNAVRIGADPLAGIKFLIIPYRGRWGFS